MQAVRDSPEGTGNRQTLPVFLCAKKHSYFVNPPLMVFNYPLSLAAFARSLQNLAARSHITANPIAERFGEKVSLRTHVYTE